MTFNFFQFRVCLDTAILLKTENNKNKNNKFTVHSFLLFICLGALFMSHEQCTRRWSLKKKI